MALPVTAAIINFQTPDLVKRATASLRSFYPDVKLLLIDNGSGDESTDVMQQFANSSPHHTEFIANTSNIHHGPAMDQAMRRASTPYVFILDTDCTVTRGGFLELLCEQLAAQSSHYVIGRRIFMNKRGFDIEERVGAIPYIRPFFMCVKRELYFTLPPFAKHGAPCLDNMRAASKRGLQCVHFSVEDFVVHEGRGTASRHGYRLGVRGIANHILNKVGL